MTDAKKTPKPPTPKKTATYVGGMPGVVVNLPSGRVLTFKPGEPQTILASEHRALADHPEFDLADEAKKETS